MYGLEAIASPCHVLFNANAILQLAPTVSLVRLPYLTVLPRDSQAVKIATDAKIDSPAEARFDRLAVAHRDGCRDANTGSRLSGSGVRFSAQAGCAPEPEIAIERKPEGR